VGEQGAVINRLIQIVKRDAKLTEIYLENTEVLSGKVAKKTTTAQAKLAKQTSRIAQPYFARGHRPAEVIVGALIGLVVGVTVAMLM
jgi:acid phosphatase family membrane protein YuiD